MCPFVMLWTAPPPARECQSMPQGWRGGQPCQVLRETTSANRRVGTKKRALRSNKETDEGQKICRSGELLDKKSPIQGPWCRFRREARARERHRHCGGG